MLGEIMGIRTKVEELISRLAKERQFPTQGEVLFVDLEQKTVKNAFIPKEAVETFLGGRGVNMFLLYNLLNTTLFPAHPEIPLIFGTGLLTSYVPSAARGNVSSWSPESKIIMDANAGDFFPSFMKFNEIDHLVIYGKADEWTTLKICGKEVTFESAKNLVGLDNIDLREKICAESGVEGGDFALAAITSAGENQVLCSGIMAGPKAIYARGGPGAKMGSLNLKAVMIEGKISEQKTFRAHKVVNREIAKKLLRTSVVKNALKTRGTPFLYKPSRLLSAMGTKNNQETTWTDKLDAENIDPYRDGMAGCLACPVNCRPLNDMSDDEEFGKDKYAKGDGPEYVTLGKFGPNIGIDNVKQVLRLNNICNDLGLDTSSTGSAVSWVMELFEKGLVTKEQAGMDLSWGNFESVEKLLFMIARRDGIGNAVADSTRAVERGHYPEEALNYLMAVKGLCQSDPHDARILKAFALGLAVATRGMDHLRNRVTLEINARINDDADFKKALYGGDVSAQPNSYEGKEIAVRRCENTYAVGDAVGMCRFTTKLFNSPSLPGMEEFSKQIENVTSIELSVEQLDKVGLNIMGVERLINARLGVRRKDDTLPRRWFDEPITTGPFKGEKIDRDEFDKMLSRFYEISDLDDEGMPNEAFKASLIKVLATQS
jgi:aldehyde:ferredoxin oxidoreductase